MGKGWGYAAGSGKERQQLLIKKMAGAITEEEEQQRLTELRQEYNEAIAAGKTAGMGNKTSSLVDDLSGVADVVKSILPDSVVSDLEQKTVKWAEENPMEAAKAAAEPADVVVNVLPKVVPEVIGPFVQDVWEDSNKPIWERESTEKILGEDGADKLQDTLNPARWAENAIDDSGVIPEEMKGTVKTILPAVLIGGAALLLITALK